MPTERQKRAVEKLVENSSSDRPKTRGEILKEVGYSDATAIKPTQVINSKGFQEYLREVIPDELLAQKHKELLEKKEVVVRNNNSTGQIEVIPTGQIDANAVRSALDMAYKLRGEYSPEKHKVEQKVEVNNTNENDIDIEKLANEVAKKLKELKTK